jgi:hypothetical protein
MGLLSDRQHKLLEWLRTRRAVSIAEIGDHFSVSTATAYRDARALVESGLAIRAGEGLKIPSPGRLRSEGQCFYCGGAVNERSVFLIQLSDGNQRSACCPHCGLLALGEPNVTSILACDFLYGRMVNASQATFLLGSKVTLCCEPSALCFAAEEDARRFQAGFGGEVCTLEQAVSAMQKMMRLGSQ